MTSQKSKHYDLRHRTLINGFGAVLIALFIFLAEFKPLRFVFVLAASGIAATALWEYYMLVRRKGAEPAFLIGIIGGMLYIFSIFFKTQGYIFPFWEMAPSVLLGILVFACFIFFSFAKSSPIINIATTFFGIIYVVIPLSLLVQVMYFFTLNGSEDPHLQGSWWIVYLIAVTKSADMGGYFIGRHFGRVKLASKLSPNKTLEGALGGLGAAVAISIFITFLGKNFGHVFEGFSYSMALIIGALIGLIGQIGDLAESLMKRDAHVKDSNQIPGVGGVLDMIDSLLFTTPVVYIFLTILYHG